MSSRSEKERIKAQQEKFQAVLANLLKDDDNKYCVDCDAKGPRWAAWNLGIFLCIRCAGIHRNLGVHVSKVKSVNLDSWTAEQVAMMMEMGNSRARAVYEANVPDNFRRPQSDSSLESFVRSKYEHLKYIAKEWVPPKPVIPKELLDDDKDKKRNRPKPSSSLQLNSAPRPKASSSSSSTTTTVNGEVKLPASSTTQNVKSQNATTVKKTKPPLVDLLGLDNPPCTGASVEASGSNKDLTDIFGGGQSDVQTENQKIVNGEENLFSDSSSSEQKQTTKDSIMALYGSNAQQQQFGVPGGMYVQQPNMGAYNNVQGPMMAQQPNMARVPNMQYQGMVGVQQAGMYGMGQQQMNPGIQDQNVMMQQNMSMYNQQLQQMQHQQMQQQMAAMNMGTSAMAGMTQQTTAVPHAWGPPPPSGQTLSTNLWQ